MKITTGADYAIRCLMNLAHGYPGEPLSVSQICEREHLPHDFTEQVLLKLRRAGLVRAEHGTNGGYHLAKDPSAISLFDAVVAIEGKTFELICDRLEETVGCSHLVIEPSCCGLQPVWFRLHGAIDKVLKEATLKSLMDEAERLSKPLAFLPSQGGMK